MEPNRNRLLAYLVRSAKKVNQRKADRLPHEAGLKLLPKPRAPKKMPVSAFIHNAHEIAEWKPFLNEDAGANDIEGKVARSSKMK